MPVVQWEVSYIVQCFSKNSWMDYTEGSASLRFAIKEFDRLIESYGEDKVRIIKQTLRRETVELG
jgi:hypothetical protein